MGEAFDDPGSPALASLPGEDIPADRPLEEHQLPVDGQRRPDLSAADALLELLEELGVAGRGLQGENHRHQGSTGFIPDN